MSKYEMLANLLTTIEQKQRVYKDGNLAKFYSNAKEWVKAKMLSLTIEEAEITLPLAR